MSVVTSLREKKWRLQPLRDKISALLIQLIRRHDEFTPFFRACFMYFMAPDSTMEKCLRNPFISKFQYVLMISLQRPKHLTDDLDHELVTSVLESCETRWKRIAEEYAKLRASRKPV